MERYDIAVIGTGPAGISAAITAKIRNKNVILFGSSPVSNKVSTAHGILNYPGLPSVSGTELAERLNGHLASLDISVTKAQVSTVYSMGSYFGIQTGSGMFEASAVILACGVAPSQLLSGEEDFLGRGVSYCATCDGQFYRGKEVIVAGYNEEAINDTIYLSELAEKVTFLPAGKDRTRIADEAHDKFRDHPNITIIAGETPSSITGSLKADALNTDKSEHRADGIFIIRDAVAPDRLVPGLKTDNGHAAVDRLMRTNIPGLFAAGDMTGAPYQYIKAAGEGNVAAISAVNYLAGI